MRHASAFGMPRTVGALLLLGGCASSPPIEGRSDDDARPVSVYASIYEAAAVSAGRFGAVPVRVVTADELEPSSLCPASVPANGQPPATRCVRHIHSGDLGWVVVSDSSGRTRTRAGTPR